ncbi:MAG: hypothetical protein PHI43_06610, partial [Candidatus Hydrothermia bacterium]|nr:hypothetical protein [Candidatus Hydrothermia bacterium]
NTTIFLSIIASFPLNYYMWKKDRVIDLSFHILFIQWRPLTVPETSSEPALSLFQGCHDLSTDTLPEIFKDQVVKSLL